MSSFDAGKSFFEAITGYDMLRSLTLRIGDLWHLFEYLKSNKSLSSMDVWFRYGPSTTSSERAIKNFIEFIKTNENLSEIYIGGFIYGIPHLLASIENNQTLLKVCISLDHFYNTDAYTILIRKIAAVEKRNIKNFPDRFASKLTQSQILSENGASHFSALQCLFNLHGQLATYASLELKNEHDDGTSDHKEKVSELQGLWIAARNLVLDQKQWDEELTAEQRRLKETVAELNFTSTIERVLPSDTSVSPKASADTSSHIQKSDTDVVPPSEGATSEMRQMAIATSSSSFWADPTATTDALSGNCSLAKKTPTTALGAAEAPEWLTDAMSKRAAASVEKYKKLMVEKGATAIDVVKNLIHILENYENGPHAWMHWVAGKSQTKRPDQSIVSRTLANLRTELRLRSGPNIPAIEKFLVCQLKKVHEKYDGQLPEDNSCANRLLCGLRLVQNLAIHPPADEPPPYESFHTSESSYDHNGPIIPIERSFSSSAF